MLYSKDFKQYQLLDMANGEKLENWNGILLIRPDPQIIWKEKTYPKLWEQASARYIRSSSGGGYWQKFKTVPESWKIKYTELTFNLKLMGFKHTGLFPEQSVNWDYMIDKISKRIEYNKKNDIKKDVKVLNLFAYTGAATLACAYAGANVCHVDSSQGMVNWAKENAKASGLDKKPIRYIVDDVIKFVEREIRRGNKYDAIIMDPPSYGRGKKGEVWNIEKDLENLIFLCYKLLSDAPLFYIINTYSESVSGTIIQNLLRIGLNLKDFSNISSYEIGLKMKDSPAMLSCGVTTIYQK